VWSDVQNAEKFRIKNEVNMNRLRSIWVLAVVALFLALLSCSKKGTGNGDDGNSPYMILDLSVKSTTDSSVTLTWTATGDDKDVGTATRYDIRYYHSWLNWATWDSAIQVTGEPAPHPAGQTDTMLVRGLMKDSTYYFALMAFDEAGNSSGISNCVGATCFMNVVVTFPDSNLEKVIRTLISKPSGDIYRSDLMGLVFLDGNSKSIISLSGVEYCTNLTEIFMSDNSVSNLGPIASLTKLSQIQFHHNSISNIAPLAGLVNLEKIFLSSNSISDISSLSGLTKLHILHLSDNDISDLSPLVANSGLAAGDTVYLAGNSLSGQAINTDIPTLEGRGVTVLH
jgi:hypothetical protein